MTKPRLPRDIVKPKRTPSAPRTVEPDPEFITDREIADGQRHKRMKAAARGKPVARPKLD